MEENELETETREEYRERLALEAQALSPEQIGRAHV